MVAAELGPHVRITPAADSIAALGKALRQLGHGVTIALPKSPEFDASGLLLARRLSPLQIESGLEVTVFDGQLASGVGLVLFDAPIFAGARPGLGDPGGEADDAERFAILSRASAAFVRERRELKKPLDVVHLHDWRAAPTAALLEEPEAPPCVLTIHNFDDEPSFGPEALRHLGLTRVDPRAEFRGRISFLRLGLLKARAVTTVSSSYAAFLQHGPLSQIASELTEPIVGILDGIDYATYNPATDPALESRYDAEDASNKGRCKTALLRARELLLEPDRPLVVVHAAGAETSRQECLAGALTRLLDNDLAIVVVGNLDSSIAETLGRLQQDCPGDLALVPSPENAEFRRLVAAADFFVTARGPVPCAHLELIAQRYGALPIAEASGGVPDVVIDVDAELVTGTGFLYSPESSDALVAAVSRAISAYGRSEFFRLQRRLMRREVGWDRPARRYVQVYGQALGRPSVYSASAEGESAPLPS